VWKNLSGGIFDVYELLPGFVFSSLAILIFSLITKDHSSEETFKRLLNGAKS
ncbi:MAG: sodium:proline symporter, partial [Nitrospirae bacterium]